MATTRIIAQPGSQSIEIVREFDAPRDLVFRAHVEPDLLARWLGPRSLSTKVESLDARHGGAWRYINRDAEGNEYGFHGVFHGTPSPDLIVQTFEFEGMPGHVALETLTFEEVAGKTSRRSVSVFQSIEDRDGMMQSGMEGGVNESMERLDELLAAMALPV